MEIAANSFVSGSVRNRPLSKRAYALPVDAVLPACLPAKDRASARPPKSCDRFHMRAHPRAGVDSAPVPLPANKATSACARRRRQIRLLRPASWHPRGASTLQGSAWRARVPSPCAYRPTSA
ncbi:hypothetical protein PVAP13_1KG115177 [Panicum virgatum]|uniref:Uncharacterized protein n=1 Tax=Panicum virgatum TaxID=38727 RepID=A0A8T0XIL0_PANVG|nr:hypothetical protein PVAP13_1KG115177 [Panicum virgatum]